LGSGIEKIRETYVDMNLSRIIRRSFIGWAYRRLIHFLYSRKFKDNNPIIYDLPGHIRISLYPRGEIAEFLYFSRFEETELRLVAAFLKPGMHVIDIGANIGLYSILSHKIVGPSGKVWSFEPSSETFQRLLANLHLNGCTQVEPIRMALSNKHDDELLLKSDSGFNDAYRYLAPLNQYADDDLNKDKDRLDHEIVRITTLDFWAEVNGVKRVDFLKVDIEGGEYKAFLGARQFLCSNPNIVVMFESDPYWSKRAGHRQQDVFELLSGLGFGLYAWCNRSKNWTSSERKLISSESIWACRKKQILPPP
jgi:FkbM family methyltransferase